MNVSQSVSHLDVTGGSTQTPTSVRETRGDKDANGNAITRSFSYDQATNAAVGWVYDSSTNKAVTSPSGETTKAKQAQLTSCTDWQGNTTSLSYYGAGDPNGQGNLQIVVDPAGNVTAYGHEPITGKVSATVLPDGRLRQ